MIPQCLKSLSVQDPQKPTEGKLALKRKISRLELSPVEEESSIFSVLSLTELLKTVNFQKCTFAKFSFC